MDNHYKITYEPVRIAYSSGTVHWLLKSPHQEWPEFFGFLDCDIQLSTELHRLILQHFVCRLILCFVLLKTVSEGNKCRILTTFFRNVYIKYKYIYIYMKYIYMKYKNDN